MKEEETVSDRLSRGGNQWVTDFLLFIASSDPLSMGPQKALETIGANLQKQYENWQPRVSALRLPSSFLTGKLQLLGFKPPLNPSERFLRSLSSRPSVAGRSSLRPPFPAPWTHPVAREGGQALAGALGGMVSGSFGLSFSLRSLGTEKHFSCYS